MSTFHLYVHPEGSTISFEKCVFDPLLTQFWSQNGPFSRHFGILHGPKRVTTGSKRAKNARLSMLNGVGSLLEKHVFDPFLSHFLSHNGPFSRHFGLFHGPEAGDLSLKMGYKHLFEPPIWSRITFGKMRF